MRDPTLRSPLATGFFRRHLAQRPALRRCRPRPRHGGRLTRGADRVAFRRCGLGHRSCSLPPPISIATPRNGATLRPSPVTARLAARRQPTPFATLLGEHVAEVDRRMPCSSRVQLGPRHDAQPATSAHAGSAGLAATGKADPALATPALQAVRPLLARSASSRPGGLPANLQGLWNAEMKPAWFSGCYDERRRRDERSGSPSLHPRCRSATNHCPIGSRRSPPCRKSTRPGFSRLPVAWTIYSTNNPFGGNTAWAIHRPGSAWLAQHFGSVTRSPGDRAFLATLRLPDAQGVVGLPGCPPRPRSWWQTHHPDGWSPEHGPVLVDCKIVLKEGDRTPIPASPTTSRSSGISSPTPSPRSVRPRPRSRSPSAPRWIAAPGCSARRSVVGSDCEEWSDDLDDPADRHRRRLPPLRLAPRPPDQPAHHAGFRRRRQSFPQRPRRRRHGLEPRVEGQLLGTACSTAIAPNRFCAGSSIRCSPAAATAAPGRQSLRRPPAVSDRFQFRRHRRHRRDARAKPRPRRVGRARRPPVARTAPGLAGGQRDRPAHPGRLHRRPRLARR